uniref:ABC transmembrane type-1 domain-containing protein n=1 Tax=Rhabditophanes sp. KR3021 TaxID=114890 RepID=A0AC35TJ54_9BILA
MQTKFKAVCLSILLIAQLTFCQDGLELKQKAATRGSNYISIYFTPEQWITIFDYAIIQIRSPIDTGTMGTNIVTFVMGILSPAQYADVMGYGATLTASLGLFTGITSFMSKISTVIGNNLNALFMQMREKSVTMAANQKSDLEISRQIYLMGLDFFTAKQMATIMCRFKRQFKASEWNKIYNGLTKFVLMAKYNEDCPFL